MWRSTPAAGRSSKPRRQGRTCNGSTGPPRSCTVRAGRSSVTAGCPASPTPAPQAAGTSRSHRKGRNVDAQQFWLTVLAVIVAQLAGGALAYLLTQKIRKAGATGG